MCAALHRLKEFKEVCGWILDEEGGSIDRECLTGWMLLYAPFLMYTRAHALDYREVIVRIR